MSLARLIAVARGHEPADLVLANARIVNVFTGEIERGDIAISGDRIAGIGSYKQAREIMDMGGNWVAPGLIDGHTHLESSLLHIAQYARAVVPRGTTALVTDLHEIANVSGLEGIRYMRAWARRLPLDVHFMVPSCVPATGLETAGACLGPEEVKAGLRLPGTLGLGEVMNFPGVLAGDGEVLQKLNLAQGRIIDGHAPGLRGHDLNAYIAPGILSDHETTTREEGLEKLRRGMYLMIREGSSEKNLEALLPLVNDQTCRRCFFVVDDRSCLDLLRDGDMDAIVRRAIGLGLEPVRAFQMASLNTAEYFRLERVGGIAPGYLANLLVLDDLPAVHIARVFHHGRLVAREGQPLFPTPSIRGGRLSRTMHIKPFPPEALAIPAERGNQPVIEVVPGQILTRKRQEILKVERGVVQADVERDILKLVVVERHRATGNIGLGLVRGFGLKSGAMASSVAHDSHNIIAVGVHDPDIYLAIKEVEGLQGGLVVASEGKVLGSLPLPVAGLLSIEPLETVAQKLERLERLAHELGCHLPSAFAALSFLALPVIPELRLTDRGLVEVMPFPHLLP